MLLYRVERTGIPSGKRKAVYKTLKFLQIYVAENSFNEGVFFVKNDEGCGNLCYSGRQELQQL